MLEHFKFKIFFLEIKLTRASSERRTVHWKVGVYSTKWASKTLEHVRISGPPPTDLNFRGPEKGVVSSGILHFVYYERQEWATHPL